MNSATKFFDAQRDVLDPSFRSLTHMCQQTYPQYVDVISSQPTHPSSINRLDQDSAGPVAEEALRTHNIDDDDGFEIVSNDSESDGGVLLPGISSPFWLSPEADEAACHVADDVVRGVRDLHVGQGHTDCVDDGCADSWVTVEKTGAKKLGVKKAKDLRRAVDPSSIMFKPFKASKPTPMFDVVSNKYKCMYYKCTMTGTTMEEVKHHARMVKHTEYLMPCPGCGQQFRSEAAFVAHRETPQLNCHFSVRG